MYGHKIWSTGLESQLIKAAAQYYIYIYVYMFHIISHWKYHSWNLPGLFLLRCTGEHLKVMVKTFSHKQRAEQKIPTAPLGPHAEQFFLLKKCCFQQP